jgi:uncharacterized protein YndB with AHSA1/START domain
VTDVAAGDRAVTVEIRIDAPPEAVFPYLTEPDLIVRWKGVEADVEVAPGGTYRVRVTARSVAVGEYVEIEPQRRVVFTWGWEGDELLPPGSSTVEIELVPDGDGTIVRLTHSGLPEGADVAQREGWEHFLPRLAIASAGGDPGPDPWAAAGDEAPEGAEGGR